MPSNVLPLRLKKTFPHIIWIFTEGEGDEIKSRLPFKIFSTFRYKVIHLQWNWLRVKQSKYKINTWIAQIIAAIWKLVHIANETGHKWIVVS